MIRKDSTRWSKALMPTYGQPTINLVKGKGCVVTDAQGNSYLDMLGGIATNILGHAHPAVTSAVKKQISTLGHVSNFYMHPNVLKLAEKLQDLTGDKGAKVFFCNSGAEANEAALKLSRRTNRSQIVATEGSFHGRTMGALSLTGQPAKRDPFKPLLSGIKHLPFGDVAAMRRAVTTRTAMVILEPIQGEAGVITPPARYLRQVREICDATGTIMAIDAVQTGMGRTGEWFGYEHEGIRPDVITIAKGLGGGLPLGAMIALGDYADLFKPGDHGTTFGGNPVACASGLAVIDYIEKKDLLSKVSRDETFLKESLATLSGVKLVRGRGLLLGIVLKRKIAFEVRDRLEDAGILVNAPSSSVIRIAPALNISQRELKQFLLIFSVVLRKAHHG